MNVNEKTALSLRQGESVYCFCGEHCQQKFIKENNFESEESICHVPRRKESLFRNNVFLTASALFLLVAVSFVLPALVPFREAFLMYFRVIWWAILLGLIIGGVIDYFVPHEYVSHVLSRPKKRTILSAVVFGFFMSVCSHGILALAIQLYKKGASTSSVVAFLLASPWANLPLTIMLIAFFGFVKALYIVLCAIVIAITTGLISQILERRSLVEVNPNTQETDAGFSILADIKKRRANYHFSLQQLKCDIRGIYQGAISLAKMVLFWILIGTGLASLAGAFFSAVHGADGIRNVCYSWVGDDNGSVFRGNRAFGF